MPDHSDQVMSNRAMLLVGGGGTLLVAAVLGLSLFFGIGGTTTGVDPPQPPTVVAPASAIAPPSAPAAPGSGRPAAATVVPALVGVDSMTATTLLARLRVSVAAVIRVPSALAPGQVVRTYPAAGALVPASGHVTLYVSGTAGGTRVAVPYLIGESAEQARSIAAQFGLKLVVLRGAGTVLAQTPDPGAVVTRGAAVSVSLG
jgi:hypothetical protein